jgi:hypothetical protein
MPQYYIIYQERFNSKLIDNFYIYDDLNYVKELVEQLNSTSSGYKYRELTVLNKD